MGGDGDGAAIKTGMEGDGRGDGSLQMGRRDERRGDIRREMGRFDDGGLSDGGRVGGCLEDGGESTRSFHD